MTFSPRALLLLSVIVAAGCSPAINPNETPHSPSVPPTAAPVTADPSADATAEAQASATAETTTQVALGGEWFCYGYQAGVGTNAVNVTGVIGGSSFQGSFHIEDSSTYASFYGADQGTYGLDPATNGITFNSGAMLGLAGTYGAGPDANLIDLHGIGNGWNDPYAVAMICQHG